MTWITVARADESGWNKDSALRAAKTQRVIDVVDQLLVDLPALGHSEVRVPDYIARTAVDDLREDAGAFQVVGKMAASGGVTSTAFWSEKEGGPVDVEVELRAASANPISSLPLIGQRYRGIVAKVDPVTEKVTEVRLK